MASDNNGSKSDDAAAVEQETYKSQLDRVATERRNAEHQQQVHPVVEKSKFRVHDPAPCWSLAAGTACCMEASS